MSQLNVDNIKNRLGAGQPDIVGVAKAFVNFNGTDTVAIRHAFNVSSITDNGVGDYTVNFENALTNYVVSFGAKSESNDSLVRGSFGTIHPLDSGLTTQIRVRLVATLTKASSLPEVGQSDSPAVSVIIHSI